MHYTFHLSWLPSTNHVLQLVYILLSNCYYMLCINITVLHWINQSIHDPPLMVLSSLLQSGYFCTRYFAEHQCWFDFQRSVLMRIASLALKNFRISSNVIFWLQSSSRSNCSTASTMPWIMTSWMISVFEHVYHLCKLDIHSISHHGNCSLPYFTICSHSHNILW